MSKPHALWQNQTLLLQVYLQPRASHDELVGWHERGLKIRIKSPPVDGAANKHLLKFIARQFKVPTSHVKLVRGQPVDKRPSPFKTRLLSRSYYQQSRLKSVTQSTY